MRLQAHPSAKEDLRDILQYYASVDDGGALVRDFHQCYLHHEGLIVSSPLLFNIRVGSVRRVNLKPRFGECCIA